MFSGRMISPSCVFPVAGILIWSSCQSMQQSNFIPVADGNFRSQRLFWLVEDQWAASDALNNYLTPCAANIFDVLVLGVVISTGNTPKDI